MSRLRSRVGGPARVNDRVLYLAWPDRDEEWMLVEDSPTTEADRREAALSHTIPGNDQPWRSCPPISPRRSGT